MTNNIVNKQKMPNAQHWFDTIRAEECSARTGHGSLLGGSYGATFLKTAFHLHE